MVDDPRVEGEKAIAELVGRTVLELRREQTLYPDPVPVRRFRGWHVWGYRDRLALWARRHPRPGEPPPIGLGEVAGREAIARVVRRTQRQLRRLLPWSDPAVADPVPVWRGEDGVLRAYRDALHDWLDRQSEHAGAGKAPVMRRWKSKLVAAKKRRDRAGSEAGPERKSASGDRARRKVDSGDGVKRAAKERQAA